MGRWDPYPKCDNGPQSADTKGEKLRESMVDKQFAGDRSGSFFSASIGWIRCTTTIHLHMTTHACRLHAVVHAQPRVDHPQMELDCVRRDHQMFGHFLVAHSRRYKVENFTLTHAQI